MSKERTSKGDIDQLTEDVSDMNLNNGQDGGWEEVSKKNKNTTGSSVARLWGPQCVAPKPWTQLDAAQELGLQGTNVSVLASGDGWKNLSLDYGGAVGQGGNRHALTESENISPSLQPPLRDGWKGADKDGCSQMKAGQDDGKENGGLPDMAADVEDGPDSCTSSDNEDDDFLSDGFDSDESQQSHETRKNHRMLKVFFESLDKLTLDEVNSPARLWHCPVCQGGPGAIFWYRGLYPLATHARTKGSVRPRLHRDFLELLEEELRLKGFTSVLPAGDSFGHWEGLRKEGKDHDIVWPAMVVIMNTRLDKGDDDKWQGMANQELLDYFSSYDVVKARHSYDSQGHRGISLLIFESSAVGYWEAERLHKHFLEQGTGREAWEQRCKLFGHGGRRQLYGYLATKDDVELFNQHRQSKQKVKYEMRSYDEMVVAQMKQMSVDNQQLAWFKQKVAKEKRHSKALEESLSFLSEKLRQTLDENPIIKPRSKIHHGQNQDEMDLQDQFFREQVKQIQEAVSAKANFEKVQQEERKKVEELSLHASAEDHRRRLEEMEHFIKSQDQEMLRFVLERDELVKVHKEKKDASKKRCLEELLELEKGFLAALKLLMEKYAPGSTRGDTSTSIL